MNSKANNWCQVGANGAFLDPLSLFQVSPIQILISSQSDFSSYGGSIPKIIKTSEKKEELPDRFVKTPLLYFNDDYMAMVKLKGQYKLHSHDKDELFIVLDGKLQLQVEGQKYTLDPGDSILVQAGEEHLTMSDERTHVLMIEPQAIQNIYADPPESPTEQ